MERFNLQKLNNAKVEVQYQIQIPYLFVASENVDMSELGNSQGGHLKAFQKGVL
jgi:hypothetical protein